MKTNEIKDYFNSVVAKANLLDVIVNNGLILPSTINKCVAELDIDDQIEIRRVFTDDAKQAN